MNIKDSYKILFRNLGGKFSSELEAAKKYFDVYECITEIPEDSSVIGRYSVLPFYAEVDKNLYISNSQLINNIQNHNYIAKFLYYYDIEKYLDSLYGVLPEKIQENFTEKIEIPFKKHWNLNDD
jgi:hypothetical protein